MEPAELSHALSGGYVLRYALDLLAKTFSLGVEVLENGVLSHYEIVFRGVSHFALEDQSLGGWERIELTEIMIDKLPQESSTEEWELSMNLWDIAELSVRCQSIEVDGAPIE